MKRVTTYFVAIGFVAALAVPPASAQEDELPFLPKCKIPDRCTEIESEQRKFAIRNREIELMKEEIELMKRVGARCKSYGDRGLFQMANECWRHYRELFPRSR
jgi:hypothetical protein